MEMERDRFCLWAPQITGLHPGHTFGTNSRLPPSHFPLPCMIPLTFYFWLPFCQIFFQHRAASLQDPTSGGAEGVSFSILWKNCRVWSALPTLWYAKWWPVQMEALAVLRGLTSQPGFLGNTVSSSPTLGQPACWLHPWKDQAADKTWIRGKLRCICLILAKFCPGYINFQFLMLLLCFNFYSWKVLFHSNTR